MVFRSSSLVCLVLVWLIFSAAVAVGQSTNDEEAKRALILEFRKLTGADTVNFGLDITLDGTKNELAEKVSSAEGLSGDQRAALEKAAAEAGSRLEAHLKSFLDDKTKFADIAEAAIFEMYDKAFTADEIRQLIAFYRSDLGQRGLKFLRNQNAEFSSVIQSRMIPIITEFIQPKIKAETDQLDQKIREATQKTN